MRGHPQVCQRDDKDLLDGKTSAGLRQPARGLDATRSVPASRTSSARRAASRGDASTTVSGVTITGCPRQPAHQRCARIQSSLSLLRSRARGRVRVSRVRTASWWRRSRFSSTRSVRASPGQDGRGQQREQFKHILSIADRAVRGFTVPHPRPGQATPGRRSIGLRYSCARATLDGHASG
jgi:hypothetical protein